MLAMLDSDRVAEIRDAIDRDGFTIVKGALSGAPIQDFAAGIRAMFTPHSLPGEDVFTTCSRIGREDQPLLHRIYLYSRYSYAMNNMRTFLFGIGRDLVPNQGFYLDVDSAVIFSLPGDDRMTWRWHQESTYHHEQVDSIGFWFPVYAPATLKNGTMSVLKGTHKLGRVEYVKHKPSDVSGTSLVPRDIDRYVAEYEEVHCVCDVGDVVVFHKDLIHRSNLNQDDVPRITGLSRVATTPTVPPAIEKVY